MIADSLYYWGYDPQKDSNVFEGLNYVDIVNNLDPEEMIIFLANKVDSNKYFSLLFYEENDAFSIYKLDGQIYINRLGNEDELMNAICSTYGSDIGIFKLENNRLKVINY